MFQTLIGTVKTSYEKEGATVTDTLFQTLIGTVKTLD